MVDFSHLLTYQGKCLEVGSALYGEGNGTPLQYSCLENPMGRGAWQAAVHGVAKSQTRLSDLAAAAAAAAVHARASQVALVVKNLPANAGEVMWVRSLGEEDPQEDGMATHSSILSWRIPWTEEPGR